MSEERIKELVAMSNLEVYREAVKTGVERATKPGQFGEWLSLNPAFADLRVMVKMTVDATEDIEDLFDEAMKGVRVRKVSLDRPLVMRRDVRKPALGRE